MSPPPRKEPGASLPLNVSTVLTSPVPRTQWARVCVPSCVSASGLLCKPLKSCCLLSCWAAGLFFLICSGLLQLVHVSDGWFSTWLVASTQLFISH